MATIQRPIKQGNATTYQGKVAAGYTKILASEMDADLDLIYSAWNTGVDTVNIADGAITGAKLAPGAVGTRELQDGGIQTIDLGDGQVTTPKLADGAVTAAKLNAVAGGDLSGTLPNPAVAQIASGTLQIPPRGVLQAGPSNVDLFANFAGAPNYDTSKSAWTMRLNYGVDEVELLRAPPNSATYAVLFSVSNAGKINGGAATGTRGTTGSALPAFSTTTYNTPVLVYTLPSITTRGGVVLLSMMHSLYYSSVATSGNVVVFVMIYRNGTLVFRHGQNYGCGGAQLVTPVPPVVFIDPVGAGTYTYDLRIQVNSGTSAAIVGTTFGECTAQEIG